MNKPISRGHALLKLLKTTARMTIALAQWISRITGVVVRWMCLNKVFWTILVIGIATAYFCRAIPLVGDVVALLVILLSALHGFALQMDSDKRRRFRESYSGHDSDYYDSQMM